MLPASRVDPIGDDQARRGVGDSTSLICDAGCLLSPVPKSRDMCPLEPSISEASLFNAWLFRFEAAYGNLGNGYIEVHYTKLVHT